MRTDPLEQIRTGLSSEAFRQSILDNLFFVHGRFPAVATPNDWYMAVAHSVRDRILRRWAATVETYAQKRCRTVCYLSSEYLLGPHLDNALFNLGVREEVRLAVEALGLNFEAILDHEEEPGLGNGGLGRLAACYMDSLATLEIPAIGYGIRYEFGIFDQDLRDGWQIERTDKWLRLGNPWEIPRPEIALDVKLGGHTVPWTDENGRLRVRWVPEQVVRGVAHDTPILGYRVNTANLLRLWGAQAVESFDFDAFNTGDYVGAVNEKVRSETISKVLYPNDQSNAGKRLRLAQQYFFVSCSLQDMIRIQFQGDPRIGVLADKYAVQMNDTHPALAVAEMMRLLIDEHAVDWQPAWETTCRTLSFTNHTLLPEALEKWSVDLLGSLLPRHLELIYEINRRFLETVRHLRPADPQAVVRLSLIDEQRPRQVRMAHLACVGSHAINGVAELHTELLKRDTLADFHALWPEKFSNKTNGVTPRRFLALVNPGLSALITEAIGDSWPRQLDELVRLEPFAEDPEFRARWRAIKAANKLALARIVQRRTGFELDPQKLLDVQIKRIHEYKRQHLKVLHVIASYLKLKDGEAGESTPRTVLFAGKAAPGYLMAKRIIKLINSVAETINGDPEVCDRLQVLFVPDYNVKHGQPIFPAAELSEQISTAGKEASGTGNMKLAMNGALTIGTLDGANIEIREEVGSENFFLFGLTAEEVAATAAGGYRPRDYYESNPQLRRVIDLIANGHFSRGDRQLFRPLIEELLDRDQYMLLADFSAYLEAQAEVDRVYLDSERWAKMSILNVARMGKFSSDRAVSEYCREIWKVEPQVIELD